MADFTELRLNHDGVGETHVNRFRVYLQMPGPYFPPPASAAIEFQGRFPQYFSPNNIASVIWGNRPFGGYRTLRFTLATTLHGLNLDFHDDWVAVEYTRSEASIAGFAVQTLRRNFDDETDDEAAALVPNVPLPLDPGIVGPAARFAMQQAMRAFNKYHFLAGRRSWMFCKATEDPDLTSAPNQRVGTAGDGDYFLETAAVERESSIPYEVMEEVPLVAKGMARGRDLRECIRDLWSTLLRNYLQMGPFKVGSCNNRKVATCWERNGDVYWTTNPGEQASAQRIHPYLGQ